MTFEFSVGELLKLKFDKSPDEFWVVQAISVDASWLTLFITQSSFASMYQYQLRKPQSASINMPVIS